MTRSRSDLLDIVLYTTFLWGPTSTAGWCWFKSGQLSHINHRESEGPHSTSVSWSCYLTAKKKEKKKGLHHLRLNQSGIKLTAQILNDVNASRVFASHRLWRGMFTVFPQWVPPGRQRELLTAVVKTFTVGRWKNINGGFLILTLNLIIKKKTGSWNWSLPHQTVAGVRTKNRTTPWLKIRFC